MPHKQNSNNSTNNFDDCKRPASFTAQAVFLVVFDAVSNVADEFKNCFLILRQKQNPVLPLTAMAQRQRKSKPRKALCSYAICSFLLPFTQIAAPDPLVSDGRRIVCVRMRAR